MIIVVWLAVIWALVSLSLIIGGLCDKSIVKLSIGIFMAVLLLNKVL